MTQRSSWHEIVTIVAVAIAARLLPLHFSPLPFNTDAFVYVSEAEQIRRANSVAFTGPTAPYPDEYLFDVLLAIASDVTGVTPLYLIQPYIAVIGVVAPLIAATFASRIALAKGATGRQARIAAVLAGLGLAVEGLYLWRTATISSENMGIAVLAVLTLAIHRAFVTERSAWLIIAGSLAALLPIVHNGTAFVGGLVLTTLITLHVARDLTTRKAVIGALAIAVFWTGTFSYYEIVDLPNASEISSAPALFVAWTVFAILSARWFDTSDERVQRIVPLAVVGGGFLVFAYNALTPVFPGSASTSPLLLALVIPLILVTIIAAIGFPTAATDRGLPLLALFFGPVVAVGFAISAGRTPEYQGLATRSQTFAHIAVLALAAVAAVRILQSNRRAVVQGAVIAVLVVAIITTIPFPFVIDEATPFQATTSPEEFSTATFATEYVPGRWAADDHVTHIGNKYYSTNVSDHPVFAWLKGGLPPACPTVGQHSWTTSGAPAYPERLHISDNAYERWQTRNDVIYATTGADPLVIVNRNGTGTCELLSEPERKRR